MKILFLTRLFHPHIGGVEKHVYKLSQELIEQNHQVTVLTTQYESSLELEDEIEKIQIIRIRHCHAA
ncbi:glycosyltransferase, partial [Pseudomonadota bacterium]